MKKLATIVEEIKWTSTSTYDLPSKSHNEPKTNSSNIKKSDEELFDSAIVQQRLKRMIDRLLYDAKMNFFRYPPKNKEEFERFLTNSVVNDILEYFYKKLEKKHNIKFEKEYFGEIIPIIKDTVSKWSDNEEKNKNLWNDFRLSVLRMFRKYKRK